MIRYLRDRCYRSVRPQAEPLSCRRDTESAFEPGVNKLCFEKRSEEGFPAPRRFNALRECSAEPTNSNGSWSDDSEILSLEHDDLELDLTSGAGAKRLEISDDYLLQQFDADRHLPRRASVQDVRSVFADEDFRSAR
jgi:hypothetical protein